MLADRIDRMRRVCFDEEASEQDLAALGSPERWLVYRDLVRTRLSSIVEAALPRTRSAVGSDAFGAMVARWLATGGPRTRYFRHVPNELADFAIPVWQDTEAPWVADLARYEIASWSVRHAGPNREADAELSFDRYPVVATAVMLLRLDHPVHEAPTPQDGYDTGTVILCLHRNEHHRAVTQTLNPLAADLLEAWQRGDETITDSVHRIAAAHGTEIGPAFVDKLSTLITTFVTQGILMGGREPAP